MTAIVIGSAAASLSGGTAYEDNRPSRQGQTEREGTTRAAALSAERGRGAAHSRFHRGAWRGFGFQRDHHGSASPVWRAVGANITHPFDRTVRHQFAPALKASGSLLLGNARFQSLQKSLRRLADRLHVLRSFRDALAFQEQTTGARSCPTRGGSNPTRNGASV